MKIAFFLLSFLSASAFAQAYICSVDLPLMNGQWLSFHGYSYNNSICRDGLRQCNRYKRDNNIQIGECTSRTYSANYTYPTNPHYNGGTVIITNPPVNNPPVIIPTNPYANMSDYQLATEGYYRGVGTCKIISGTTNASCNYYVKANINGYLQGFPANSSGCSDNYWSNVRAAGCNNDDDFVNAGCLLRRAYQANLCY